MSAGRWSAVLPIKRLTVAKSRLAVPVAVRPALALAFATDTLAAVLACPAVGLVVVVTDDAEAADVAATMGASVVGDEPDRGLNPALVHGARRAQALRAQAPTALVSADLPALRPQELGHALSRADGVSRAFVCDAAGTGTTLLTSQRGKEIEPAFGPRSRARHRAAGMTEIVDALPSVRRDVDTAVDLWDAVRLGVGPATRAVLTRLEALPPDG